MALKQDERALLQLVCERGQSYDDLAGLLGISREQVRQKARAALTELGGSDPDTEVGLTDYLLGQADPIGRADAVRYLQQDERALALAGEILTGLRAIAPGASLPKLPEPRGRRRRAATPARGEADLQAVAGSGGDAGTPTSGGPGDSPRKPPRDPRQTRMIGVIAGLGVILLLGILVIAGVFSGSDPESEPSAEAQAAEEQRDITPVTLRAEDGSGVAGRAEFGVANETLYVDLTVNGLDPRPAKGSVYALWLMLTPEAGYPVTLLAPTTNGTVQDRYAIPTSVAVVVGSRAQFVQVSESPAKELGGVIDEAVQTGAPLIPFSGTSLARGEIPLAEVAPASGDTATAPGETTTPPETTTPAP